MAALINFFNRKPIYENEPSFDDGQDLEAMKDDYYLHIEDEYEDRYIYEELIRD